MLTLKKLIESKNPELLANVQFSLFGNTELANIFKLTGLLYADHGDMPSWDLISAELTDRVTNTEKQRFYTELIQDIKDKDAQGITTDELVKKLQQQRQFRVALDGADRLVEAVEKRDADLTIGIMRETYEKMFATDAGMSFDSADMANMAGQEIKYEFEKTGIEPLDKRGGLIKGGLTSIAGQSKAGKSLLAQQCITFGHNNYDGSSAYFTYEQQPGEIRARILSARSNIDVGFISSGLLTPYQRLDLRMAEVAHLCNFDANMKDFCVETKELPDSEFWPTFWSHFQPRANRFYIPGNAPDWDSLFIQMQMLVDMKNVRRFVIDYPMIIPRGGAHRELAGWEYNLLMSRNLKSFARNNGVRVIAPAQYDDKADNVRYCSGVINDVDLMLAMTQEDGDQEYGDMGAITVKYKAFRNFLSIVDQPTLEPFKLLRAFNFAKFENFPEF